VITLATGLALRDAGVVWTPRSGDRFAVPDRDLDDQVFVVSEMVVDVRESPVGPLLAFNGTTEWALDSLQAAEAVWLPREDQLRELLGDRLLRLERLPGPPSGWAVDVLHPEGTQRHVDLTPESAYARALLA
jgi:hypothetical protein